MNSAENKEHLQALIGSDYELQWIIGHGGMSTVWLADDTRNDREVALKVLRRNFPITRSSSRASATRRNRLNPFSLKTWWPLMTTAS